MGSMSHWKPSRPFKIIVYPGIVDEIDPYSHFFCWNTKWLFHVLWTFRLYTLCIWLIVYGKTYIGKYIPVPPHQSHGEKPGETKRLRWGAMGQDAGQLCEVARSKYRRFMLPSKDSRPEAGRWVDGSMWCEVFFSWSKVDKLGGCFCWGSMRKDEVENPSEILRDYNDPKDPDMSWERDFPYNPILGMGFRPLILI